jgi:hypothetical protein
MTRQSLSINISDQVQSLDTVWQWYEFQQFLIGEEKSRLFGALARGESPAESRYFGKTREELDDLFVFQNEELGHLSMFAMLACVEATLRVDFDLRVRHKEKDVVSRKFRNTAKEQGNKIHLEDDILDVWKEHSTVNINSAVQRFKDTLNLRNWLAHGRYGKPKLGRVAGYKVPDVFDICRELLLAIPLMS